MTPATRLMAWVRRRDCLHAAGRAGLTALALAGVLVGVSANAQAPINQPEVHHIHGLAVDRRDPEILYIATHTGLVRVRPNASAEWVGSHRFDLMGFTADPRAADLVYASGHPDLATYQQSGIGNLGLLVSRDGGRTWQSFALKGGACHHGLHGSPISRRGADMATGSRAGPAGDRSALTGEGRGKA
jgi:hypothetical protein